MNQSSQSVLRYLTGNENIEDVPVEDLQKLADEHPYFPVTRFLLAKKLQVENHPGFLPQVQTAALYFSNPLWLHYLLNNPLQELPVDEKDLFDNKTHIPQKTVLTENEKARNGNEAFYVNKTDAENDTANEKVPETKEFCDVTANEREPAASANEKAESNVLDTIFHNGEKAGQPEEEMAAITRDTDDKTQQFLAEISNATASPVTDNIEPFLPETLNAAEPETIEFLEEMAGASRETDEVTEVFLSEAQATATENIQPGFPEAIPDSADDGEDNDEEQSKEQDEHEIMFQNIKAMLDATSEEADADIENTVIPLDPYYTIDYFASQGIKLELDQNPKDELGQHLKKFTQWLKHMKKLGPEDATEVIARTETEADIQQIADSSNTVREVVTEAMASVLEKQGKKGKAIELYNKLSFLNPDKSTYFAAKIKNLKGI